MYLYSLGLGVPQKLAGQFDWPGPELVRGQPREKRTAPKRPLHIDAATNQRQHINCLLPLHRFVISLLLSLISHRLIN